jgi:hypothetical protein
VFSRDSTDFPRFLGLRVRKGMEIKFKPAEANSHTGAKIFPFTDGNHV